MKQDDSYTRKLHGGDMRRDHFLDVFSNWLPVATDVMFVKLDATTTDMP
jgi:hypothetical protein